MAKVRYGGYQNQRTNPYPPKKYKRQIPTTPCAIYTRTGRCDSGRSCRYAHIPERVALCIPFFKTGKCVKQGAERCKLSHTAKPQNTPMCTYFARGHCSNGDECSYVHMTNLELPSNGKPVPICHQFALNGWCERGSVCSRRHTFDCPDFEEHGRCTNAKCQLQHVIRSNDDLIVNAHAKSDELINIDEFVEFVGYAINHPSEIAEKFNCVRRENDELDHIEEPTMASDASSGSSTDEEEEEVWEGVDSEDEPMDVNADFIKV